VRTAWIIVLAALALASLTLAPYASLGQPAEDQAYQAFVDAGCTKCHNGAAPDWNGTVQIIIEWAQTYDNIDDAVYYEYGAASYDDMMQEMASYTPGITDEQYQILYNFFLELFNYYKQQASQTTTPPSQNQTTTTQPAENQTTTQPTNQTNTTQCPTQTITKTVTKTVTETITFERTVTVTKLQYVEQENPEARTKPPTAAYAPIVATVLVIGALGYILYQLRS